VRTVKYYISPLILLSCLQAGGQNNPPVAENDTIHVYHLNRIVMVYVTDNDHDPDGDPVYVYKAPQAVLFTDTSVKWNFTIAECLGKNGLFKMYPYYVWDSIDTASAPGWLYVWFHGHAHDTLNINRVSALINSNGSHFWDLNYQSDGMNANPCFQVPAGGGTSAVFTCSLWMGGLNSNGALHLSANHFLKRGSDFWPGPVMNPALFSQAADSLRNRVWKVSRNEVEYHKTHWWAAGYQPPEAIINWPGNGNATIGEAGMLAPFHDWNNNGVYEPQAGDYPLIKGDQCVCFIYNDTRWPHGETGGKTMGLEILGMAYAFDCPEDSALAYTIFFHYNILNRSANTYHDTYLAFFADTDLGYSSDDFVRCDVARGSFYTLNAVKTDGQNVPYGYGAFPPAISTTILAGPFLDPDNLDNPAVDPQGNPVCGMNINGVHFGDSIIDNERMGLTGFIAPINVNQGYNKDPEVDTSFYKMMKGIWLDGEPMAYGGIGHPDWGGFYQGCRFMFPGLSDPCNWGTGGNQPDFYQTGAGGSGLIWDESRPENLPQDWRGVASMGPFTFLPGDRQELDVAFVWARQYTDSLPSAAVNLLTDRVDQVRYSFYHDTTPCGGSFSGVVSPERPEQSLLLYPNPVRDIMYIVRTGEPMSAVFDILDLPGRIVRSGTVEGSSKALVSVGDLKPGLYFICLRNRNGIQSARFLKIR